MLRSNEGAYRKLQARCQLRSKAGQVQNAGLAHDAFGISDQNVASHHQTVDLQGLQVSPILSWLCIDVVLIVLSYV